ncbi:hypothetical protein DC28_12235 [Spirochaeta lutea]|uniref:ABC transporter permease n=1 Tax=Spirochaeta lutea TaxID=1480694 RepID=A0A098QUX9_9SPIO|nr:hypothetical protein DC28_12235 [Spirochaeta lutea]
MRLFRKSLGLNLKGAMEYRGNFLLQVFGMVLNNLAFLVFWDVLLGRTGPLAGYGFSDILFLWGVTSGAFGLAHILFGNISYLGEIIRNGDLDVYLLQPKGVYLNLLTSRSIVSAWGDLLFSLVVLAFAAGPWGLPGISRYGLGLVLVLSGSLVFAGVFSMAESLNFFLGNARTLGRSLCELLLTASLYPEGIFGSGMRWLFYSLIPAGFVVYLPRQAFLELNWAMVVPISAGCLGYFLLGAWVFHRGLRRYESGNLVGSRV